MNQPKSQRKLSLPKLNLPKRNQQIPKQTTKKPEIKTLRAEQTGNESPVSLAKLVG